MRRFAIGAGLLALAAIGTMAFVIVRARPETSTISGVQHSFGTDGCKQTVLTNEH